MDYSKEAKLFALLESIDARLAKLTGESRTGDQAWEAYCNDPARDTDGPPPAVVQPRPRSESKKRPRRQ